MARFDRTFGWDLPPGVSDADLEDEEEVEEEEYDNMRALDDAWDREPDEDDLIEARFERGETT